MCLTILDKNRRLKAAKDEAQSEIENYRKQREAQFQEQQRKVILMNNAIMGGSVGVVTYLIVGGGRTVLLLP